MTEYSDVLVVGGGVIGVCTAYSLAERGANVRLVERGQICSGCSHGNAGWIFPSHSMPLPAPGVIGHALDWLTDAASPFYIKPRPSTELARWLWRFRASTPTPSSAALIIFLLRSSVSGFGFLTCREFDFIGFRGANVAAFGRRSCSGRTVKSRRSNAGAHG